MKRKDFLDKCSACGAMSLLGLFGFENISANTSVNDSDSEPMNQKQITQLLKFIDSSVDESDKEKIFQKLGIECLYSRNYDKFLIGFRKNIDEYFDRVKRGESKYWDKLEYNKGKSIITLVGKKRNTCACQYGQCEQPPKSLCNYCCKRFQEELFGLLLEKKVNVRIDESVILGGERCSTTIFVS